MLMIAAASVLASADVAQAGASNSCPRTEGYIQGPFAGTRSAARRLFYAYRSNMGRAPKKPDPRRAQLGSVTNSNAPTRQFTRLPDAALLKLIP